LAIRQLQGNDAALKTKTCESIAPLNSAADVDGKGVTTTGNWEKVKTLTSWRGNNAGCLVSGKATAGACSSTSSGTAIGANPPIALNRWLNGIGGVQ